MPIASWTMLVTHFDVVFGITKKRLPTFKRAFKSRDLFKCRECHGWVTGWFEDTQGGLSIKMRGPVSLNPEWDRLRFRNITSVRPVMDPNQ